MIRRFDLNLRETRYVRILFIERGPWASNMLSLAEIWVSVGL